MSSNRSSPPKPVDKGTGLGLSQVYGFAHQSGGTIAVASEPGRGTRVTIYLPRSDQPAPPTSSAPEPREANRGAQGNDPGGGGQSRRQSRRRPLCCEQLNYRTVAVESAAAGARPPQGRNAVDLVFTDVVLPGDIDGVALALTVRQRYPHIPVLLTSGYARVLGARHGLPILRKPYELSALAQAIQDNLNARATQAGAAVPD